MPFVRPAELATSEIHAVHAVLHCIEWLKENEDYQPDLIVMLLATGPLRLVKHIDGAIEYFLENEVCFFFFLLVGR